MRYVSIKTSLVYVVVGMVLGMASFPTRAAVPPNTIDALRDWLAKPRDARGNLNDQPFASAPLTKGESEQARQLLWDDHVAEIHATREKEWRDKAITVGAHTMKWKQRHFGTKPAAGWDLYISLHGGGGVPAAVNDQQWENQINLYQPENCLYIAPRAPTNDWNLWFQPDIDIMLDRMIDDAIVLAQVNPNRIYLTGYSAGGNGTFQLAPRMADRWAAAATMAGHPPDGTSPLGLRNLPFGIHNGALDDGYDRNKLNPVWKKMLDDLQNGDPGGYVHDVELHPGVGHWMNHEEAPGVEWMGKFTRQPLPQKVVWKQSSTTHDRFYWLAMPPGMAKGDQLVVASRQGQTINIEKTEGTASVTILLNDAMLDMDQPVKIIASGKEAFNGTPKRTIGEIAATLAERGDPSLIFDGSVTVPLTQVNAATLPTILQH